ncbi:MAG TPA: MG2 domain-containing protein [Spirochaetales bacterium]|nr:MG2 domain-containing protein [Spirochaetales bacterium]
MRNFRSFAAILAITVLAASCSGGLGKAKAPDPARVEAHTAGLVSRESPVRVVLLGASGVEGASPAANPFRLEPPVKGRAVWEDERTLAFKPDRPLEPGRLYKVRFDLGLLVGRAGGASGAVGAAGAEAGTGAKAAKGGTEDYFSFSFRTVEQRLEVAFEPLRAGADGSLVLEGSLSLAEGAGAAEVERVLAAAGPALPGGLQVAWSHDSARLHRFAVKGIARGPEPAELKVSWKGRALGAPSGGSRDFRVPPAGSFELLGARAAEGGRVELSFSEPLDRRQDFRGLVSASGVESLRFDPEGGRLSLYATAWPASARIKVEPGLRAQGGATIAVAAAAEVSFAWEKPELRFLSKSAILPTSQGLTLPVETMNLSALIIEAVRVQGDNMLQFLQVNDLDSSCDVRRVGEVVWRKTVDLGWKEDWKNRWVRQGLDLSPLLAAHKDGMFQIRITFRKDHIRYVCPTEHDFRDLEFPGDEIVDRGDDEYSLWDYVQEWGDDGYGQFYKYKNDPCHPAYYLPAYDHDITQKRNVLVSDLGATARLETDGAWTLAASDLRTAAPVQGAAVSLYNFQRRLLSEGRTGADGMVRLLPGKEPSFAVVALGSQRSYLKLDPGSRLAVSHFDVGGEKADDGVKGFIYGERGVWRPGDPIHLTFVLYDRSGSVPAGLPVLYELEDPRGRVVRSGTSTGAVNGFYSIETSTNSDSPTGPYLARVRVGGRSFTKAIRVETVMPNRLKVKLELGGAPYLAADSAPMRLESAWLTGAPAGALRADVSATFQAAGTSFTSFKDYDFDDPTREVSGERAVLFEGELGPDGKTSFPVDLSPEGLAPGRLRATLLTRVFEPSGVFSSETAQFDYHPYGRYAGLKLPKGDQARGMLLTDQEHRVELALVDRDGKPVPSGTVEVSLYQLEWRWWWEKGDESLAETANSIYERPLKRERVRVEGGRASFGFKIAYPNWGRFLIRVEDVSEPRSGRSAKPLHSAGKVFYVDWPGYAGKGRGEGGGAASMLSLEAGKEKYSVGEKVQVSFPSNAEGRALVAIERAGRLVRQEWVRAKGDRTVYEFQATPDMAPNVYIHVSFLQPHLQTANDLPIRLYGVVPVMVEDPATRLSPLVLAPSEIEPNSEVSFSVREASGRPMTCTVAVVDEGLLGITRFRAPNPWDEFYKKEASALASYDLYQYVAGAFSGKLETLLAVGGGDEGLGGGQRKVSRFPPVVQFFPPFEVKAGETVRKSFRMGPYVGAVRFMVVAGSGSIGSPSGAVGAAKAGPAAPAAGAAYGAFEKEVPVRSKLMAQLTAPRLLSPGEEAAVPATVFSFLGKKRVRVSLAVSGAAALAGPGEQYLDYAADGDLAVPFRVKAGAKPGAARLVLRAEAEGFSAEQAIDLEVRPLGIPVTAVVEAGVEAGKEWSAEIAYPGAPGTNKASLELSRLPTLNLGERLAWLIQYPHGCSEQTTSKAFPQLYLPESVALPPERLEEVRRNVSLAIAKLGDYQTPRGGFTFWPGEGADQDWLSAYVAHFLVAARRAGYEVRDGVLDPALAYLAQGARLWNSRAEWSKSVQAYRLYVLALAGKPEPASMNRFREYKPFPAAAHYRLAAAYALSGQREAADSLLRAAPASFEVYEGLDEYTYGSPFRERAAVLEALNALGDLERGLPVYRQIALELNEPGRWLSTQEIGAALSAGLPYASRASKGEAPELLVTAGDGTQRRVRLDRASARIDLEPGEAVSGAYSVKNLSKTPVFAKVVARGVPAAGQESAVSNGLSISVGYFDMDENPIDPNALPLGQDLVIEAVVRNRTTLKLRNLALTQVLPAGWEIANYRVGEELPRPREEGEEEERRKEAPPLYEYQDIRDDRVLTYFTLEGRESKTFRIYANKTYDGSFYLPSSSVESMYDARYQAVEPGRWLSEPPRSGIDAKRRERNMRP